MKSLLPSAPQPSPLSPIHPKQSIEINPSDSYCWWLILGLPCCNVSRRNPVPWQEIRIQCRTEPPLIQPCWFWLYSKGLPRHSGVPGLPSALVARLNLPELCGCCPKLCFYFICNPLKAIAISGRGIIFRREAAGDGWDCLSLPLCLNSNLKRENKISLNFNKLTINHLWKPPDEDMDCLGYEWEQLHFTVIVRPS